jgi:hypothetical protein
MECTLKSMEKKWVDLIFGIGGFNGIDLTVEEIHGF